jgi:hypothetical protein
VWREVLGFKQGLAMPARQPPPTALIFNTPPLQLRPVLVTIMIAETKMRATLGSPQSKFQPQKN